MEDKLKVALNCISTLEKTEENLIKIVNKQSIFGDTLLHHVAAQGNAFLMELLIKLLGADVNIKNTEQATPLHYASTLEIFELLIANGAEIDDFMINHILTHKQPEQLNSLIAPLQSYIESQEGRVEYLHQMVIKNDTDAVKFLVEEVGMNAHFPNLAGQTAFSLAYAHKHHAIFSYLLDNFNIDTAQDILLLLHSNLEHIDQEIILSEWLKANIDKVSIKFTHPISFKLNLTLFHHLIYQKDGTPLALAMVIKAPGFPTHLMDEKITHPYISFGAENALKNPTTALHVAAYRNHFEDVKLLVENGTLVHQQPSHQSPLEVTRCIRIFEFLIENNAFVDYGVFQLTIKNSDLQKMGILARNHKIKMEWLFEIINNVTPIQWIIRNNAQKSTALIALENSSDMEDTSTHLKAFHWLLDIAPIDVNFLHEVIEHGSFDKIQVLVTKDTTKILLNSVGQNKLTAISLALLIQNESHKQRVIPLLVTNGAYAISKKSFNYKSPLNDVLLNRKLIEEDKLLLIDQFSLKNANFIHIEDVAEYVSDNNGYSEKLSGTPLKHAILLAEPTLLSALIEANKLILSKNECINFLSLATKKCGMYLLEANKNEKDKADRTAAKLAKLNRKEAKKYLAILTVLVEKYGDHLADKSLFMSLLEKEDATAALDCLLSQIGSKIVLNLTTLHHAVRAGNMEQLKLFLANPDSKDMLNKPDPVSGKTLLESCLSAKNSEAAKLLLDAGASINQHNSDEDSPLMAAVKNNNCDLVSFICQIMESDPEKILLIVDDFFHAANSPEMLLCLFELNNLAVEKILKLRNVDLNKYQKVILTGDNIPVIANQLLQHAIKLKNPERVSMLVNFFIQRIERMADYQLVTQPISTLFNKLRTTFNLATDYRQLITEKKIDYLINSRDKNTQLTPLEVASIQGDIATIEVLVKQGAKLPYNQNQSTTSILPVVQLLYDSRFSIKVKEALFDLLYCSARATKDSLRELISNESPNPQSSDKYCYPFFYHLLKQGTAKMLKAFLSQLEPEEAKIIVNRLIKTSEFLAKFSIVISETISTEVTPLYLAAMMNDFEKVQLLISLGANINEVNSSGETILQITKNSEITSFLLDSGAVVNPDSIEQAVNNVMAEINIAEQLKKLGSRDNIKKAFLEAELDSVTGGKGLGNSFERLKYLLNRMDGSQLLEHPELVNKLFSLANKSGKLELVHLILNRCGDINQKNIYGDTLLHIAVQCNNADIVDLILNAGGDKEAKNANQKTAADLAYDLGYFRLSDTLKPDVVSSSTNDNSNQQNLDSLFDAFLERAQGTTGELLSLLTRELTDSDDDNMNIEDLSKIDLSLEEKHFSGTFFRRPQYFQSQGKSSINLLADDSRGKNDISNEKNESLGNKNSGSTLTRDVKLFN